MTSKEALEEFNKEFGCDLAYYNLQDEYDIIKKDLDLLEIVKKLFIENLFESDDAVYSDIMIRKDSDEYAKIKEFLKNEQTSNK